MFQSFEVTARPEQGPPRLKALRAELAAEGLAGFLIPRADHQSLARRPLPPRRVLFLINFIFKFHNEIKLYTCTNSRISLDDLISLIDMKILLSIDHNLILDHARSKMTCSFSRLTFRDIIWFLMLGDIE